jgi:hypothetical protein
MRPRPKALRYNSGAGDGLGLLGRLDAGPWVTYLASAWPLASICGLVSER